MKYVFGLRVRGEVLRFSDVIDGELVKLWLGETPPSLPPGWVLWEFDEADMAAPLSQSSSLLRQVSELSIALGPNQEWLLAAKYLVEWSRSQFTQPPQVAVTGYFYYSGCNVPPYGNYYAYPGEQNPMSDRLLTELALQFCSARPLSDWEVWAVKVGRVLVAEIDRLRALPAPIDK